MKRRRVAARKTPLVIVSFLNIPKDVWFTCILERWLINGLLRICDVMRFCLCHPTLRNWSIKYELPRRLFVRLGLFDSTYMKDADMEITWIRLNRIFLFLPTQNTIFDHKKKSCAVVVCVECRAHKHYTHWKQSGLRPDALVCVNQSCAVKITHTLARKVEMHKEDKKISYGNLRRQK